MDILSVFKKYRENIDQISENCDALFDIENEKEWTAAYFVMLQNRIRIYGENSKLYEELEQILQNIQDDATADSIYQLSMEMYQSGEDDYLWLMKCFDALVPYYELDAYANKEKLVWLYSALFFENNKIKQELFSKEEYDYTYLYKILEWKDFYDDFSEEKDRSRFWTAYFNLVLMFLKDSRVDKAECFKVLDEMLEFCNSETVVFLDGDNEEMQDYVATARNNVLRVFFKFDEKDISEDIIKQYCDYVFKMYETELEKVKNKFDLRMELYAGRLFALYLQKKRTINEIFDSFLEYYGNRILQYQNEVVPSIDALGFYIDSVQLLSNWANLGLEKEKIHKMIATFMNILEHKWKNISEQNMTNLNFLLTKLCPAIVQYGSFYVNEEECVKQMLLKRNFYLYLHSKKVQDIAMIITECVLKYDTTLFEAFSYLEKEEIISLVASNALFHDIGKISVYEMIYAFNRPNTEEEILHMKNHPQMGAELLDHYNKLKEYRDTAYNHHFSYDGENRFSNSTSEYRNPDNKIIVDIVHIADYLANMMEMTLFSGKQEDFSYFLNSLEQGSGTEFHPQVVAFLAKDKASQSLFEGIISENSMKKIFQTFKEMNHISVKQNFDEYLEEVNMRYRELKGKGTPELIKPYFVKLLEIASDENSNRNLGITYFLMMSYYYENDSYMECMNYGLESIRCLEKTTEYEYLCRTYQILGHVMLLQGSIENGIRYYLRCADYAKMYPEGKEIRGFALFFIATLMKASFHYPKALYYYQLVLDVLEDDPVFELRIVCSMALCVLEMQDIKKVTEYLDRIESLEKKTGYSQFDLFVSKASIYRALGRKEQFLLELEKAEADEEHKKDISKYVFEINQYISLLEKENQYVKMGEKLDEYIRCSQNKAIANNILMDLIQRRIYVSYVLKDDKQISYYGNYLYSYKKEITNANAKIALQMEKSYLGSIARQRKQREMEDQRKKLEKEVLVAEKDNEQKTRFLSNMSHEIRTPINAILGLDEMILRECHEDQIIQYAQDIKNAGKTLVGVISDVLDVSKMEDGKMELRLAPYMVSEMIFDLKNMIEPRAKDKNLKFEISCNKNMPKELYGDCLRVKQIIINVLTNAVKYTKEGEVTFSINFEKKNEDSILFVAVVKDTGIGMKKEHLEKLSNPFVRFDEVKNRNIEGTGLGMNIVNNLIKQMDGNLEVTSEYGKGSEFKISLPQVVGNWEAIGDIFNAKRSNNQQVDQVLFTMPEAEILLVDDNIVNLKVVSSLLKRTRVKVTTAKSGRECLDLCEKNQYDLIFMDHRMPELDGVETLKLLKQMSNQNASIPVVALTANALGGGEEFYRQCGFDELITKPVDHVELEQKMKSLLKA